MKLLQEILVQAAKEVIYGTKFKMDYDVLSKFAIQKEHTILSEIIEILSNPENVSDFEVVERIVSYLEYNGISCGRYHDID